MGIDWKQIWNTKRKLVLGITAGVTAAAIGCGLWYQAGHSSADPVYVFPFQYVGMTEYWGDTQESNGPVTTDKIQTVFLSDTQTVTEILAQTGDTVKKGDLLMAFDTTLSDLQMERKRLDVEKLKLQLEDAKDELKKINSMKPMQETPSTPEEPEEESDLGPVHDTERLYPMLRTRDLLTRLTYNGSTPEKALIYWILDTTQIDQDLFREAELHAAYLQSLHQPAEPDQTEGEDSTEGTPEGDPNPASEENQNPSEEETTVPEEKEETAEEDSDDGQEGGNTGETQGETGEQTPSNASTVENPRLHTGDSFYVVFKITEGNREYGAKTLWQCLKVKKTDSGYSFKFADTKVSDYSVLLPTEEEEDIPQVDLGSGFTAAQIAQMRSDQQKKIKDLEFQIKMTDAEYKIMLKEVSDGNIYAEIDGKVVSVLTEEEARSSGQPIVKVSGGGGFYIEGFISELEKENMKIGQEVTVNDWNTGMTYTGNIVSMGVFPIREGYFSGNGNPNASYYPFQVFVDETADLQAGSYVSVQYSNAESKRGIYLENPFLRTEKGRSYVYVLGTDNRLEQRWVTTGKSLWGNYTEILDGLTAEDLVAFPYGKHVKPGVAAQEGDLSDLYG